MNLKCPKCQTRFSLDSGNVPLDQPMAVCPECRYTFFVREPDSGEYDADVVGPDKDKDLHRKVSVYTEADRHRLHKRYLVWLLILFMTVVAYQVVEGIRSAAQLSATRETAVKTVLKRLAIAQESYLTDKGSYAENIEDLKGLFRNRSSVMVVVTRADDKGWAAKAWHVGSKVGFTFDSQKGGFQEPYSLDDDGN